MGGIQTLAEEWDGTTWRIEPTPAPAGTQFARLTAVACATAVSCVAVGTYTDSASVSRSLAERWDGTTWRLLPVPDPAGGGRLNGVACTSSSACIAVGGSVTPLVEQWDGATWRIQAIPSVSGTLNGVACTSSSACIAVGNTATAGDLQGPLAEGWDGTTWRRQRIPNPGGPLADLTGISCANRVACTAVGEDFDRSQVPLPLAEAWNGTTWSIQLTPKPGGASSAVLSTVARTSVSAAVAVGGPRAWRALTGRSWSGGADESRATRSGQLEEGLSSVFRGQSP